MTLERFVTPHEPAALDFAAKSITPRKSITDEK
jgi:hypothetical protein